MSVMALQYGFLEKKLSIFRWNMILFVLFKSSSLSISVLKEAPLVLIKLAIPADPRGLSRRCEARGFITDKRS